MAKKSKDVITKVVDPNDFNGSIFYISIYKYGSGYRAYLAFAILVGFNF